MYNTNAPLGLKPVDYRTGAAYAGKANQYRIASAYSTNIGQFDPVVTLSDGTIGIGVAGSPCIGLLDYVEYFSTAGAYIKAPNWTASTSVKSGTTAYAYVFDDPFLVMDAQETDGASGAGTPLALTDVGLNINFAIGAPNSFGVSTTSINNTTEGTASTYNLKIMALSNYPGNAVGNYANWFVTWNAHQLKSVGTIGT